MFKYNLQSVLTLKEKMEDAKKKELGEANKQYEQELGKKNQLIQIEKNVCGDIRNEKLTQKEVDITYIKQANAYMNTIKVKIQNQEEVVCSAKKQVENKRDELVDCVKERKILENLRDIHFEEYLIEESRIEQKAVDEVLTYRYKIVERE